MDDKRKHDVQNFDCDKGAINFLEFSAKAVDVILYVFSTCIFIAVCPVAQLELSGKWRFTRIIPLLGNETEG